MIGRARWAGSEDIDTPDPWPTTGRAKVTQPDLSRVRSDQVRSNPTCSHPYSQLIRAFPMAVGGRYAVIGYIVFVSSVSSLATLPYLVTFLHERLCLRPQQAQSSCNGSTTATCSTFPACPWRISTRRSSSSRSGDGTIRQYCLTCTTLQQWRAVLSAGCRQPRWPLSLERKTTYHHFSSKYHCMLYYFIWGESLPMKELGLCVKII